MDEAQKTRDVRSKDFYQKYLSGKVIDIGAGNDLVCGNAEGFDVEDGDANWITKYREKNSYDAVHSSHCLEHMLNPLSALKEWWALIKPGGYLVLVVPHEDLYEQGYWPSRFNFDHKFTFRVDGEVSWSPVSYNIKELVGFLPEAKLISVEVHSQGYDVAYKLSSSKKTRTDPLLVKFLKRVARLLPKGHLRDSARVAVENFAFKYFQVPIDQTLRGALAQIQVVVYKEKT